MKKLKVTTEERLNGFNIFIDMDDPRAVQPENPNGATRYVILVPYDSPDAPHKMVDNFRKIADCIEEGPSWLTKE